mgnify:FL=1
MMRTVAGLVVGLFLGILLSYGLPERHPLRVAMSRLFSLESVSDHERSEVAGDDDDVAMAPGADREVAPDTARDAARDSARDSERAGMSGGADHAQEEGGDGDDDDVEVRDRGITFEGARALALTPYERTLADIQSRTAEVAEVTPVLTARAEVFNASPALTLVRRITSLTDELAVQQETERALAARLEAFSAAAASPAEQLRLTTELRQARRERIALAGARVEAEITLSEAIGPLVGVLTGRRGLVDALAAGDKALVLLTLPVGERLPAGLREVALVEDTDGVEPRVATLLTPAPSLGGGTPGSRYFLLADAGDWVPGMLLSARIPQPDQRLEGVAVPRAAIVWHQGLRWVYVEPETNIFVRYQVGARELLGDDRVVLAADIRPGTRVVVQGAQALLAEEFRTAIPEEDDD